MHAAAFTAGSACQPTTYEGSAEDLSIGRLSFGGFSRSTFVTERKGSAVDLLDSYRIMEELGAGATSTVYRAVNKRTGEEVAVKMICKVHVKDAQMLKNEIQIHKATDHPNVLRLLEVFEDDRKLYLVTELCRGGDLGRHLGASCDEYSAVVMPEADALQLIQQVVNSVLYLHSRGIVHRDLKPSNFLCASSGSGSEAPTRIIKLADFGVSAYCSDKHRLTRKVGTEGFMAPEIIRHQPYNEKADIFSIGCILHMMLTGHPPKEKGCGHYISSKMRLRFVSEEMQELVSWLLQPRPEDRPSASEVYQLPLLRRQREQGWVHSARLDAQLLDNMYAYSSFPLLKKAALVAMVSRAESDANFSSCIEKFMSLDRQDSSDVTVTDLYKALRAELVEDMGDKARQLLGLPSRGPGQSASGRAATRWPCRWRRPTSPPAAPAGAEREAAGRGLQRFQTELRKVAEDLVHKIDASATRSISYCEWLAATADASWYTNAERIQATFRLFDTDGDGVISQSDLKKAIPDVFQKVDVREVLLESEHCPEQQGLGIREKDFILLLQTHRPSKYTLKRIRAGFEDPLLPAHAQGLGVAPAGP